MKELDLGDKFDTTNVTNMNRMFDNCGYSQMTSLYLGDKFNTIHVIDMTNMFYACGNSQMTSLDLGQAFRNIAAINDSIFQATGKSDCIIYCHQDIYEDASNFKLNASSTTTIPYMKQIEVKYGI